MEPNLLTEFHMSFRKPCQHSHPTKKSKLSSSTCWTNRSTSQRKVNPYTWSLTRYSIKMRHRHKNHPHKTTQDRGIADTVFFSQQGSENYKNFNEPFGLDLGSGANHTVSLRSGTRNTLVITETEGLPSYTAVRTRGNTWSLTHFTKLRDFAMLKPLSIPSS